VAYPDIRDVIEKFDFDSQIGRLDAGTTRIAQLSVRASFTVPRLTDPLRLR